MPANSIASSACWLLIINCRAHQHGTDNACLTGRRRPSSVRLRRPSCGVLSWASIRHARALLFAAFA